VYIRSVPKNVATNPIARAVARQKLRHKIVDQKIALYLMEDGDDCVELMEGLGTTLAIIGMAAEMEPKICLPTCVYASFVGGCPHVRNSSSLVNLTSPRPFQSAVRLMRQRV